MGKTNVIFYNENYYMEETNFLGEKEYVIRSKDGEIIYPKTCCLIDCYKNFFVIQEKVLKIVYSFTGKKITIVNEPAYVNEYDGYIVTCSLDNDEDISIYNYNGKSISFNEDKMNLIRRKMNMYFYKKLNQKSKRNFDF